MNRDRVIIVGSGPAGLITAHTLLNDGFSDVQILTQDKSPGGVWAAPRIYPTLALNNVHGEFRFSSMPMDPPKDSESTGGRLYGVDMCAYMERFAETFLQGRIRFNTEVLRISRGSGPNNGWSLTVKNLNDPRDHAEEEVTCAKIVLCTGVSKPSVPPSLSPATATSTRFDGLVFHSLDFPQRREDLLKLPGSANDEQPGIILVVGGGKSAQDISAAMALEGKSVHVVFEAADAFLASPKALPAFIRKSRLLSVFSPHIHLRTRLERFLHTTSAGAAVVRWIWKVAGQRGFDVFKIPESSPLRHCAPLFWNIRTNDEGVARPSSYHALAERGAIQVHAPARLVKYEPNGVVVLSNGEELKNIKAVVLCTGYHTSWEGLFDDETAGALGLTRPSKNNVKHDWQYLTLTDPPAPSKLRDAQDLGDAKSRWQNHIYRGIVPAKNILNRDFALNGAVLTTNNGYAFEVSAHWISAYFMDEPMRLPASSEEAVDEAEREAQWLEARHPNVLRTLNDGYQGGAAFLTSPQYIDDLLDDLLVPSMRSGGNWLTWPFKVVDVQEVATLREERQAKRHQY